MINVVVPYGLNNKLAEAYNRSIEDSKQEWVLFVEHDIFLACNPHWYEMCIDAIKKGGEKVALFTCVMNGNGGRAQEPYYYIGKTSDIDKHVEVAERIFRAKGNELLNVTNKLISGYFLLVRKKVALEIPFRDMGKGVNKIDYDFCDRLLKAGYEIKVMTGLYVYHRRGVRKLNWKK